MWLINKWYSQTIDIETEFLYASPEEEIHKKITQVIVKLIEENYMYDDILDLIKCIYGLVKKLHCWFKEYINTTTL